GANAQTMLESVIIPIEEQVNGVEDMDYITSTGTNNGTATINVVFKQGVNPDIAAVNVQNRVARATPLLPAEVTRSGVVVQKQNQGALMFVSCYDTDGKYHQPLIQNAVNVHPVAHEIRRNGVRGASGVRQGSCAMRICPEAVYMARF